MDKKCQVWKNLLQGKNVEDKGIGIPQLKTFNLHCACVCESDFYFYWSIPNAQNFWWLRLGVGVLQLGAMTLVKLALLE
jgi:hypothetical protein